MLHITVFCRTPVTHRPVRCTPSLACLKHTCTPRMQPGIKAVSRSLSMYSLLPELPTPDLAHPLRTQPSSAMSRSPLGVYSLLTKLP